MKKMRTTFQNISSAKQEKFIKIGADLVNYNDDDDLKKFFTNFQNWLEVVKNSEVRNDTNQN